MNYTQSISKIRERGQLTVPLEIRKALNWPDEEVIVRIVSAMDGFRVERLPISHPQHPKKRLTKNEWDKIYQDMETFSKTGRQDIKLTEFIRKDRDNHL